MTAHLGTGQFGSRKGGGGEHRHRVCVQQGGTIQHQPPRLTDLRDQYFATRPRLRLLKKLTIKLN